MKHTKNNIHKKEFQNFYNYMLEQSDSPNTDTSKQTKKNLQKVYLLFQHFKQYEKQKKIKISTPPPKNKKKNNTETKPYKWNTSAPTQNKHFQNIPYNKKTMTQKHQRQLLQQRQLTDQDSSDESQNHSSQHSNSSKTTSSSIPDTENSHDESQNFFPETEENTSSSESPPPQQQQQNSQDAFFISKQQILQNYNKYGEILQTPDPNYTHVRLYRLPTMLTPTEYKYARKRMVYHKKNQRPCQNYLVVDVCKKTMFRCPLSGCEHSPLNNLMIHQALKKHCQTYHNDGHNYIFHYKTDQTWRETHYPPESTNKNFQNPMTQQYKTQKGQKVYHNPDVNSNNSYEWKGKNPFPNLPNNSYNQNNCKGKNPFPALSNNSYNNPQYKGQNPFPTLSNNTYDQNNHKGNSPYTNEQNIIPYHKNDHKGQNPFPILPNTSYDNSQCQTVMSSLPNPQYSNPNEYTSKEPCSNFTNNNYDPNYMTNTPYNKSDHKGQNPFPPFPNNTYPNPILPSANIPYCNPPNEYTSKGPSTNLAQISQQLEYKGKGPSTTSEQDPQQYIKDDYCHEQTEQYQKFPIPETNPEDEDENNKVSPSTPPISPDQEITPKPSFSEP